MHPLTAASGASFFWAGAFSVSALAEEKSARFFSIYSLRAFSSASTISYTFLYCLSVSDNASFSQALLFPAIFPAVGASCEYDICTGAINNALASNNEILIFPCFI